MSLINLLPHREVQRRRLRERWRRHLLISGLVGCLLAALGYFELRGDIADLHAQLDMAQRHQAHAQRGEQTLRQDQNALRALQARLALLKEQQMMQIAPMVVVNEIARTMPQGMTLSELRIEASAVSHASVLMEGHAVSPNAVSAFVTALAASARALQSPELLEMAPVQIELAGERPRVQAFSVRARVARELP